MLLHSCPDTVHRVLLRKTQTSTPLIKGSSTRYKPQIGITPAVADCRYRAPLSPRLRGHHAPHFELPPQTLLLQLAQSRHPRVTQKVLLSAAAFLP